MSKESEVGDVQFPIRASWWLSGARSHRPMQEQVDLGQHQKILQRRKWQYAPGICSRKPMDKRSCELQSQGSQALTWFSNTATQSQMQIGKDSKCLNYNMGVWFFFFHTDENTGYTSNLKANNQSHIGVAKALTWFRAFHLLVLCNLGQLPSTLSSFKALISKNGIIIFSFHNIAELLTGV